MKHTAKKTMEQIATELEKEFELHDWMEVTEEGIRIFHNCGCHDGLLDDRFNVEPNAKFEAFLSKNGVWYSIENSEAGQILFA